MATTKPPRRPPVPPSDETLREYVAADIASCGLSQAAYAASLGVSRDGLQKFLLGQRGASLDFARRLLGAA